MGTLHTKPVYCNVCGGPASRETRCTNGRCGRCHRTYCTGGGASSPGHGRIEPERKSPLFVNLDLHVLERAFNATWQLIGPDAISACGEDIDNEQAIEMCYDADHLSMFDTQEGKDAEKILRAAFAVHGVDKVRKELCKHLSLM